MPEREYVRKIARNLTALRWTGQNTAEVQGWLSRLGGSAELNDEGDLELVQRFRGVSGAVVEVVNPGDYLVLDDDEVLRPRKRADFERVYTVASGRG